LYGNGKLVYDFGFGNNMPSSYILKSKTYNNNTLKTIHENMLFI